MEQPFVAVAGVVVGIKCAEIQGQVPGNVRAVDDRDDAALACAAAELANRQRERCARCVVAEVQHLRA
jgi:hypothetical protein